MLGDEDRRTIGGNADQKTLERLNAAGRGADENDAVAGTVRDPLRRARDRRGTAHANARVSGSLDLRLELDREMFAARVSRLLGDEIDGADLKRLQCDFGTDLRERRHHDHGRRPERHDLMQEGESVHLRHLDVEGDDVGIQRFDAFARDVGIGGGADDLDVGIGR